MKGLIALLAVLLALGVMFFFYASPSSQPAEMTEPEIAQIEAEVEAFMVEYGEAWDALDVDRVESLYVQTPEFASASDGVIIRGFDAVQEGLRAYYGDSGTSAGTVEWIGTDSQISVLSRDAAVVLSVGTVEQTTTEGATGEGIYTNTLVLVRRDGEWKVLINHMAYE